jgi:hypothetical protein
VIRATPNGEIQSILVIPSRHGSAMVALELDRREKITAIGKSCLQIANGRPVTLPSEDRQTNFFEDRHFGNKNGY